QCPIPRRASRKWRIVSGQGVIGKVQTGKYKNVIEDPPQPVRLRQPLLVRRFSTKVAIAPSNSSAFWSTPRRLIRAHREQPIKLGKGAERKAARQPAFPTSLSIPQFQT